ncbi:restriction endonuclease subunit S [Lactiplantibacillus plantarum]|uniref:restriction endonuclease subunit S n=1 Tax=Lactiplantibacillus plantarum TaxID=1590 RepID=UPI003F532AF4
MKNENLVPKVRFKGFSDPWEQRKLGNYVIIKSGDAPSEFVDGDEPYLKVDDLNNSTVFQNSTKHTVKGNAEKMIQSGSIVFSKRGAAILTNKVRILEKKMFMDTNMMALTPVETDLYFLYFLISEENLSKIADTSTIPQINNKHIIPYTIYLPCLMEQQRLGKVLILLSNLIAANEDKLEQLKTLKKLMMQKIFSQEWRFKGFTDPWEQRKLLEIADRLSKSSNSENLAHVEYADIISGEGRLKSESLIQKRTDSRSGIQFVAQNVLYGKLRPYLNNWLFPNFPGIAVGDFWVFQTKKGIFAPFLYALIQSPKYQQVANISTGTKMPRSDWKKVSGIHFEVPIEFNEQRKIGNFFLRLDSLIAANEDKLNQLKELKKYLMQNMFV